MRSDRLGDEGAVDAPWRSALCPLLHDGTGTITAPVLLPRAPRVRETRVMASPLLDPGRGGRRFRLAGGHQSGWSTGEGPLTRLPHSPLCRVVGAGGRAGGAACNRLAAGRVVAVIGCDGHAGEEGGKDSASRAWAAREWRHVGAENVMLDGVREDVLASDHADHLLAVVDDLTDCIGGS